jgi:lipooligosaccharide transport system permease protein
MSAISYHLPVLSLRFVPVWRRNLLVWRKLAVASVIGNIAEPMITLLAFGTAWAACCSRLRAYRILSFWRAGRSACR